MTIKQDRIDKRRRQATAAVKKKHAGKKAAKGSFHCACGQRINSLKDRQSVTCGSCGATHYGPK